jgi:hypothetical protein
VQVQGGGGGNAAAAFNLRNLWRVEDKLNNAWKDSDMLRVDREKQLKDKSRLGIETNTGRGLSDVPTAHARSASVHRTWIRRRTALRMVKVTPTSPVEPVAASCYGYYVGDVTTVVRRSGALREVCDSGGRGAETRRVDGSAGRPRWSVHEQSLRR